MASIDEASRIADVVIYVEEKLASYEFVDDLKQFILDQRIGGEAFLSLTDKKLKEDGLKARGDREKLLGIVKKTRRDGREERSTRAITA